MTKPFPSDEEIAAFDNRELPAPSELPAGGCALYSLDACTDDGEIEGCESCGNADFDYGSHGMALVPTPVGVACALLCDECTDSGNWPTWNRNLPTSSDRVIEHARHVLEDIAHQARSARRKAAAIAVPVKTTGGVL